MNTAIIKKWAKVIVLAIGIFLAVVVILNYKFFWLNIKHTFVKPNTAKPVTNNQPIQKPVLPANMLQIDSLGISAPIVYVNAVNEGLFQAALGQGVVHYPGTAKLGETGNAYIFGHSSDLKWARGDFKTVFALLPRAEIGMEIRTSNESGKTFVYVVTEKFVASSKDVQLLSQETGGKKMLTLQTSYPIGTALKRYIVKAEMRE